MVELRSTSAIFGLESKWIIYHFQMLREALFLSFCLGFFYQLKSIQSDFMAIRNSDR